MPTPADAPSTVLVTGGSSGIGRASALQFAGRGARLVLVARGRSALEEAAAEGRAAGAAVVGVCPADVTDEVGLRAVVEGTVSRFGRLDVDVDAAPVMAYVRVEDVQRELFDSVVRASPEATANLARPLLPVFRRQ